jgi:hypothetical protein
LLAMAKMLPMSLFASRQANKPLPKDVISLAEKGVPPPRTASYLLTK